MTIEQELINRSSRLSQGEDLPREDMIVALSAAAFEIQRMREQISNKETDDIKRKLTIKSDTTIYVGFVFYFLVSIAIGGFTES